jgi:hypothetical protein
MGRALIAYHSGHCHRDWPGGGIVRQVIAVVGT